MSNKNSPSGDNISQLLDDAQDNNTDKPTAQLEHNQDDMGILAKHLHDSHKHTEESWGFYYKVVRDLIASGEKGLLVEIKNYGKVLLEHGVKYIHQVVVPRKPIGKAKLSPQKVYRADSSKTQKPNTKA